MQAGLELMMLLSQPPKCWSDKTWPLLQIDKAFLMKINPFSLCRGLFVWDAEPFLAYFIDFEELIRKSMTGRWGCSKLADWFHRQACMFACLLVLCTWVHKVLINQLFYIWVDYNVFMDLNPSKTVANWSHNTTAGESHYPDLTKEGTSCREVKGLDPGHSTESNHHCHRHTYHRP